MMGFQSDRRGIRVTLQLVGVDGVSFGEIFKAERFEHGD